ncbi:ligase-associated DNA damage response endonuclease PdeM [Caulobacter sp. KR2-114]|uniref:ligase-associated DNA damage response endonuclease PdeM n=1 Tax=Caulobacter sp. KR2-114 TaxID=3400912 RepID=UPI003C0D86DB
MSLAEQIFSYAFARRPDGSLAVMVAETEVVLRASGALWLERERALVVADLHLEKGSSFARRGQMLPPYDTRETLDRLEAEVRSLAPRAVVLLGDTFHDRDAETRLAGDDAGRLAALAAGRALVWVVGNHDEDGPAVLPGEVLADLSLAGLALIHQPTGGPARAEVAGHLHPCARVAGKSASVRRRCFVTDGERLVLPAFGAYAGGLNVLDPAFRPLLARPPLAVALGRGQAHPVGWRSLRPD